MLENEEINNERIQKKIELRQNRINNILFTKRKIKEYENERRIELEKKIKKLENIVIPDDFQLKAYKYYESVVFL